MQKPSEIGTWMNRLRSAALLAICVLQPGCVSPQATEPSDRDHAIVAVSLRIMERPSFATSDAIPICIGWKFDQSPSEWVLRTLAARNPRVTSCRHPSDGHMFVVIRQVAPFGDGRFRVTGGYYCGQMCGDYRLFLVERRQEGWVVVTEERLSVS